MSIESDIEYHQSKLRGIDIQVEALRQWLGQRLMYDSDAASNEDISLVGYLIDNLNGGTERGYHEKKLAEFESALYPQVEPLGEADQALTDARIADEADDDLQYRRQSGDLGAIGNFQS